MKSSSYEAKGKTRASTLLTISSGMSELSKKGINSYFFLEDYQRFLDYSIEEKPRLIVDRVSREAISSKDDNPGEEDEILSYIKSPNGRNVSSIYNGKTQRPSNFFRFVQHNKITEKTLYSYVTSEYVEILNLENCNHLKLDIFRSIGEFCPNLKILNLENCDQLGDDDIFGIVKGCKNIISLNLSKIPKMTDKILKSVFLTCKYLKILSLHSNPQLKGTSFQFIQEENMIELVDLSFCYGIMSLGFLCISEFCTKLKHLNLTACKIEDEALLNVCHNCADLQALRLILCEKLTGDSLTKVTEFLKKLKTLELTGCSQVDDEIMTKIGFHGQKLQFLSASGCVNITDQAIESLSVHAKSLRVLELSKCRKLTLDPLIDVIHEVKTLRTLILNETKISKSEIEALEKVTRRCQIVKQSKKSEGSRKSSYKYYTVIRH